MNILEYPALSVRSLVSEVRRTQSGSTGCSARAAMEKADVRGVQFRKEIRHFSLKIVGRGGSFELCPVALNCGLPISIQFFGRIEPLLQSGENVLENRPLFFRSELDGNDRSSHCIRRH